MTNITALNQGFGIPGQVIFKEASAGSVLAEVSNRHCAATIALQGGHLMNWTPHGSEPVLWLSRAALLAPGKSIRGGVPICWPWFGPHPTESTFPAHGFARTVPWEVIACESLGNGETRLALRLAQSDRTRPQWPHPCQLEIHMVLGAALEIDLLTRNSGDAPIVIGEALHTYFEVGDVRRIAIQGLDGCWYLDKVDAGKRKRQTGAVTIAGETDRIYLDSVAECTIDDPGLKRRIRIGKRGSRSTVVWNPWLEKAAKMGDLGEDGYLNMVCVESANAAENRVTVMPGDEHRLAVTYRVEALS